MDPSSNTMDNAVTRNRPREVLVFPGPKGDTAIDRDDFVVLSSLFPDLGPKDLLRFVGIEDSHERRIEMLIDPPFLPRSIGRLQNLKELKISSFTFSPPSVPEEIWDLISLTKLNLHGCRIKSLPPSIGQLRNLKELYLSDTSSLSSLPEGIGDLISLTKLDLHRSKIKSLPSSIGRLRNLKELYLSDTSSLSSLPEEIGGLISLTRLNLRHSNIKSLPSSIGRLQNLTVLKIGFVCEEMIHLQNLKCLHLTNKSSFHNILVFGRKLRGLVHLDIDLNAKGLHFEPFLKLVNGCPWLAFFTVRCDYLEKQDEEIKELSFAVSFAVARNRCRFNTRFLQKRVVPKLWPFIIENARHACNYYDHSVYGHGYGYHYGHKFHYAMEELDALYQLLSVNKESFIVMLTNRNRNDMKSEKRTRE